MNNPIGAVRSMAQSNKAAVDKLKRSVTDDGAADAENVGRILAVMDNANQVIEDGTRRVAEVVETLRNFANLDEAEVQWFDVHEGLEDTLVILQHQIKPSVKINKQYTEVPRVNCFPAQLNQVFLNILTNANEAIHESGEVTISTSCQGGNVRVSIRDTGVGIPEENRKKIFDPGFTTKGVGVGTGLGLAICYQIIKDHDGDINVDSEVGKGSVFTVVLPTTPRKVARNR
ncbi:MAG: HAMP domain-containing histidine kinase [Candidatus Latescibacterota bacterium]|nr:MAG: HAMP domain-containing histidine kinase [Candidatus Latescibacterota bacterium]